MVMKNRWEEAGWWDDLPPRVRERFSGSPFDRAEASEPGQAVATSTIEPPPSLGWLRDSSLLAVLLIAVGIINAFLLVLVLALVDGVTMPWPLPGR
jgi:hypothetical protein